MDSLVQYLTEHRFAELFREELGWDRASGMVEVSLDEKLLQFEAVAQKRGLQVLQCIADRRVLFNKALLRQAQRQIARAVHEHILIYACHEPPKQVWQWAVRLPDGTRLRHREHPFFSAEPPGTFVDRLRRLRFSLDEELDATLVDALDRVRLALDVSAELNLFPRRTSYADRSDELAVAMLKGDPGAFHQFIVLHRPLARRMSKRLHYWFGMDPDDAEQIGVIGLIEAARRFDPKRGFQFSTYANHWIRQACQRLGPEAAFFIRLPAHIIQSYFPFRRTLEQLALQFGYARVNDELLRRCLSEENFYRQWLGFERVLNIRSLSDRREPEFSEARRMVASSVRPLDQIVAGEYRVAVQAAVNRLESRERRIVHLRYGFDGPPHTLEEIGIGERITRERVRQILKRAEERLQILLRHEVDCIPAT